MSIFNFDLSDLLDKAFDWIIKIYFSSIAELFSYIGTIGSETLDLPWVSAFVTLCKYIGWGLFVAGLAVAVFDLAIEYQSGRADVKSLAINLLKAFFAVSLFTVLPIDLFRFCVSLGNTFSKDLISFIGVPHDSVGELLLSALETAQGFGTYGLTAVIFVTAFVVCVIKVFLANLKRGGILLIQIAVGSLHMFSLPRGYFTSFTGWCKQVMAICFTTFMQNLLFMLGLIVLVDNYILGLGLLLASAEVPRIADQFGLDTSVHGNVMSVVHASSSVIHLVKTIGAK